VVCPVPVGPLCSELGVLATREHADVPQVLQLRLHGNRRTGRSTGVQVHRCAGATLDMTESTWLPQPLHVVFPQRWQRAGLHMWCSFGW
jgi:hypothetical protein